MTEYFSDRERGVQARTEFEVNAPAWGGLVALVNRYVSNGGFGADFPDQCPDGRGTIGTDQNNFGLALHAEIPDIRWPLWAGVVPPTLSALDLVEFCYRHVAEPSESGFHAFFQHNHLSFDRAAGQTIFRSQVNLVLSRNAIAFTLEADGRVIRLAPPVLDEELHRAYFETDDAGLNKLMDDARAKFLDPDPVIRRESLEKLWDAWERLKTMESDDKKATMTSFLNRAAAESNFRAELENEARALTKIGNSFHIRHSEKKQVEIQTNNQVDYLFHRLFALILLLLRVQ